MEWKRFVKLAKDQSRMILIYFVFTVSSTSFPFSLSEWTYQYPGPINNDVFFSDEDQLKPGLRAPLDYRWVNRIFSLAILSIDFLCLDVSPRKSGSSYLASMAVVQ